MKRKKLSEKNRRAVRAYGVAAEQIGNGERFYACFAIDCARNRQHSVEFQDWFRPREPLGFCGWWPDISFISRKRDSFTERTMRILALLLMAELVRDGQIDFDVL